MGAREVPPEAITEAAEAVAEKIDVLLERATDAALGAPQPGSDAWQQAWAVRDTDAGRAANAHRTRVKTATAVPPQKPQKQSNTVRHGDDQFSMW